ncbi:MAG TPA: hypothetical protein VIV60_27725 [Polyangiaceae bacterium]
MMRKAITAGIVTIATFLAVSPAHAEESPTAGKGSVGALLGYGFKDGLNLGFGVRGGYTLPANIYLGGTFVYHLGKTESTPFGDSSVNIYYFGFEGGYDFAAGPVVIRPYLGLGAATARVKSPGIDLGGISMPSTTATDTKFAAWPGATLLYPMGSAFIGGDARFLVVSEFNAFSLFATGGLQF